MLIDRAAFLLAVLLSGLLRSAHERVQAVIALAGSNALAKRCFKIEPFAFFGAVSYRSQACVNLNRCPIAVIGADIGGVGSAVAKPKDQFIARLHPYRRNQAFPRPLCIRTPQSQRPEEGCTLLYRHKAEGEHVVFLLPAGQIFVEVLQAQHQRAILLH